jgi:RNA polymerase sigma-70 factor (ECF subfamily)
VQTETDDRLVAKIRNGEREAFGMLYRRYRTPLYSFCVRMLAGDGDRAADAVHEAFVKLFRSASGIREGGAVRTWLYRTVRNEVLMMKRREDRMEHGDPDTVWDLETPHTILERAERSACLEAALRALRREYREVLLLREEEGLSYAEIAVVTGDSAAAVKARLFKARKGLAELLGPRLEERRSS